MHILNAIPVAAATVLALPESPGALPAPLDKPRSEHVNACVCEGVKCLPPFNRLDDLQRWFASR